MTSSFGTTPDERHPRGRWGATWGVALGLVALGVVTAEGVVRSAGFEPEPADDARLWALVRHDLPLDDPTSIVAVGSSRIQCDLVPERFAAITGESAPIQLAIFDSSPLPVLEDLVAEPRFVGTVILEISPELLFSDQPDRIAFAEQRVSTFHAMDDALFDFAEERIRLRLQTVLAAPSAVHDLPELTTALFTGERPRVATRFGTDRVRTVDGRSITPPEPVAPPSADEVATSRTAEHDERIEQLERLVHTLVDRGGHVVLVQLPADGRPRHREIRDYPRSLYWDPLVERLALPALHWQDDPVLASLQTTDGSHLDAADAATYTETLARFYEERAGGR